MSTQAITEREPVTIGAIVNAAIPAGTGLVAAFSDWMPTSDQLAAIGGAQVVVVMVVAFVTRRKVTPGAPLPPPSV